MGMSFSRKPDCPWRQSRADGAAMEMPERRGSVFWKAPESRVGITHSQWVL